MNFFSGISNYAKMSVSTLKNLKLFITYNYFTLIFKSNGIRYYIPVIWQENICDVTWFTFL